MPPNMAKCQSGMKLSMRFLVARRKRNSEVENQHIFWVHSQVQNWCTLLSSSCLQSHTRQSLMMSYKILLCQMLLERAWCQSRQIRFNSLRALSGSHYSSHGNKKSRGKTVVHLVTPSWRGSMTVSQDGMPLLCGIFQEFTPINPY
jgi:hypothetical protein